MNNRFDPHQQYNQAAAAPGVSADALSKSFMANVFSFMFVAVAVTGLVAYLFGTSPAFMEMMFTFNDYGVATGYSGLHWIAVFAPFAFILIMGFGIRKMHPMIMLVVFVLFAGTMGMSLSTIFLVYSLGSIYTTFLIASGTFGIMALVGYTTKTDLTKFGSILMMGLLGLVLAMVVNWFVGSEPMQYLISVIGVLIFTGLTAYDVQKLKRIGSGLEYGTADTFKMALWGATDLYLDFINLFLFLLRIFGSRD